MSFGDICLTGPLLDAGLRRIVLGAALPAEPCVLEGWRLCAGRGLMAGLVAEPGARAQAVRLGAVPAEARARLDFLAEVFGGAGDVREIGGGAQAIVYASEAGAGEPEAGEVPGVIEADRRAAADLMALRGAYDPARLGQAWPQMRVRADTELRAGADTRPARHGAGLAAGEVHSREARLPYLGFFALAEHDLDFPRFAGGRSSTVTRAAFLMADAVTVLPYDPARDRVLLVEQFRVGPLMRGDPAPWLLEPIAGRIDPGETPEQTARREAREEARLELGALHEVGRYYPSPGAVTEFLYSYVATADLPDGTETIAGVDDEAEDIRSHVLPFEALMALTRSAEAANGPLLLSALWLAANRERLRAMAGQGV